MLTTKIPSAWSQQKVDYSFVSVNFVTHADILANESGDIEIPRDSITLEKEIGQGEFGVVMKAVAVCFVLP